MRKTFIACVTLFVSAPVLAQPWPPYAPPAYGGYPGPYGAPYAMPPGPMMMPGYPGGWEGAPFGPAWAARPSDEQSATSQREQTPPAGNDWSGFGRPLGTMPKLPRLDVSRGVDGNDYVIDIQVQNIDPEQIQIRPTPRGLVLAYDRSVQRNQEDSLPGGDGYRRSYSLSRGLATRSIGLPADAKLDAMSREVGEGHIRLRIPRDASAPPSNW